MKISETKDYHQLIDLFIENGLEFSKEKPVEDYAIVKCWKAEENGALIAGCMLIKREGHYRLEGIAVKKDYRNSKIGSELLKYVLDYIKEHNADSLYLVAKVPTFYKKHGFKAISREQAPIDVKCFCCPQYQNGCFPEIMKISI